MKKFFSLLAISISVIAGFSACGEEDATYTPIKSSIKIVNSKVDFDCLGGEGSIVFESENKVSFSCDSAWVELSQPTEGTITVKVDKNYNNLQERNAIIKLSDGQGEKDIVVIQLGITQDFTPSITTKGIPSIGIVENEKYNALWLSSNEAATYAFGYSSEEPLLISTDHEDWFSVQLTKDSLYISVEPNTTGHLRQGLLFYECGALRDVMIISQYDENEDIYGPAKLIYYTKVKEKTVKDTIDVNVTKDGIEIPGTEKKAKNGKPWVIPMKNVTNSLNFNLTNKDYAGDYGGKYDLHLIALNEVNEMTFEDASFTSMPLYDEQSHYAFMHVGFDPEWYGFVFSAFVKDAAATEANVKGNPIDYFLFANLVILPKEEAPAASFRDIDIEKVVNRLKKK